MNPFSLRFFWKALRGHSVTFALLFAVAALGFSTQGALRDVLRSAGIPTLYVWVVPFLLLAALAKYEDKLIPREGFRRALALSVVALSAVALVLLHNYRTEMERLYPPGPAEENLGPAAGGEGDGGGRTGRRFHK